jgi:hypothetical protein
VLTGKKRRASSGATLLAVILKEKNSFFADAIDVRRLVSHQAGTVGADVGDADVITPDDEDIRFLSRGMALAIVRWRTR